MKTNLTKEEYIELLYKTVRSLGDLDCVNEINPFLFYNTNMTGVDEKIHKLYYELYDVFFDVTKDKTEEEIDEYENEYGRKYDSDNFNDTREFSIDELLEKILNQ